MNGVKLACLYSYGGCQQVEEKKIGKHFLSFFAKQNPKREEVAFIIKILRNLQPYGAYCQIRDLKAQKNPFSPKVVRAYWLGDRSIGSNSFNHNFAVLKKFRTINADEHLPAWIVEKLLDCAVSYGEVIKLDQEKAKVLNKRLLYKGGKVVWGSGTREVDIRLIPNLNLKKGDLVSIHWAIAREKISQRQAKILQNITIQAIRELQIA